MQPGYSEASELEHEVQQVVSSIQPFNPKNIFKLMVYNYVPPYQSIHSLQTNLRQPTSEMSNTSYNVDSSLFHEAMVKNPDPTHLYPWQINSCEQLAERTEKNLKIDKVFKESLMQYEEKLRRLDSETSGKTVERIAENAKAQGLLFEKLCRVRLKLERLLEGKGYLSRDSGLELKLRAKIDEVQLACDKCRRVDRLEEAVVAVKSELKVPDEQAADVLRVLREQRKAMLAVRNIVSRGIESLTKIEAGLSRIYSK